MTIIFCNFFLWAPFCVVNVLQAVVPHLLSNFRFTLLYLNLVIYKEKKCDQTNGKFQLLIHKQSLIDYC